MLSEYKFSTPSTHMAKYAVAAGIAGTFAILFINIVFQVPVNLIYMIIPFVFVCLNTQHTITLDADSLHLRFGWDKKDYALTETFFQYGEATGPSSWFRSMSPRTDILYVQRQGGKLMKLPVHLSHEDFEALIAALKERGAFIEPF